MEADNCYRVFRMKDIAGTNGREDYFCYVAEGPVNGKLSVFGKTQGVRHDQPIKTFSELGGLIELAYQIYMLHTDYLNDIDIGERSVTPYLGFSFEPPYQFAMWDRRVWQTERLSNTEKTEFLQEMQKQYDSSPRK